MNRKDELINLLKTYKEIYYGGLKELNGIKPISDEDFDLLEDELLETANDIILDVGSPVKGTKIKHNSLMLSIKKTKDKNDIHSLLKKGELVGSHKMDGNACSLKFKDGNFYEAVTRGDGKVGNLITRQMNYVNFPKVVSKNITEIRGEVVISKNNFISLSNEMVKNGLDKPESIRNIVAGLLNPKKVHNLEFSKYLDFLAYSSDNELDTYENTLNSLEGFNKPIFTIIKTESDIVEFINEYTESLETNDYLTDGIVFRINNVEVANEQGKTEHHFKHSIAYKLNAEIATTEIISIDNKVGRTGKISYVANVKPVKLGGAKISRCTLHNASKIVIHGLGCGSTIKIQRSNEVIPKFIETVNRVESNLSMLCPSCGEELTWNDTNIDLMCTNKDCPGIYFYKILHFIKTLDIIGFSEKTLEKLFELGYIEDFGSIFELTYKAFLNLPKYKKKSAENLYNAIQEKKNIDLVTLLTATGIPNIGKTASKIIVDKYKTIDNLLLATVDEVISLEGIGDIIALSFIDNLDYIKNSIEVLKLAGCNIIDNNSIKELSEGKLEGLGFCITGTLSMKRGEFKKLFDNNGGFFTSSITSKTNYLICNDLNSSSTKFKKAKEKNINIITEDTFFDMIK